MKVLRLEFAKDREHGPFNPPIAQGDMLNVMLGMGTTLVPPADAAQAVAKVTKHKGPYQMPGILRDTDKPNEFNEFARNLQRRDRPVVFGFSSMKQYHEWFETKQIREALFVKVSRAINDPEEWSGLELREFDVPDDKVFVAKHQVAFDLTSAISSREIPREQAIA